MPCLALPCLASGCHRRCGTQSLVCFSANPDRDWTPAFASLDDTLGLLHKLVRASDLTVCLDRYCAPDPSKRRQVQAFEVSVKITPKAVVNIGGFLHRVSKEGGESPRLCTHLSLFCPVLLRKMASLMPKYEI